ncbi:MAG: Rad52/Rad22 family DNA repair protein, partial [Campylobacterota bacterium]|nr:Rad52/Rad22 family DNA repair protein [Campylobacterota bacterium]
MFTDKQNQLLKINLDGNRVKTRQQGNITLSYLEGFDIIDAANFAFGYGNWGYEVKELAQVSEEINEKQNKVIGYKAIVTVTVFDVHHKSYVVREDIGFGTGIAREYASAHESAGKEAVTDGLKRAFRTFGNQFGNALYDKSQKNVDRPNRQSQPVQQQAPKQIQQPQSSSDPYAPLYQLGLGVQELNGEIVVTGQ